MHAGPCLSEDYCVSVWRSDLCHPQVRLRCQKGIPPSLRGRAWLYLSGGKVKREQNVGKFNVSQSGLHILDYSWFVVVALDVSLCISYCRASQTGSCNLMVVDVLQLNRCVKPMYFLCLNCCMTFGYKITRMQVARQETIGSVLLFITVRWTCGLCHCWVGAG